MNDSRTIVIGVAGGSASGKSLVAARLVRDLEHRGVSLLDLDSYYRSLAHLDFEARREVNFDHPDAFDFDLLREHLDALREGRDVDVPIYDYARHDRRRETRRVRSQPIVIVEGILVFAHAGLRELMDVRVFVETAADVRLLRRIRRDILERGRELEEVLAQYVSDVAPMHDAFVEPSKRHADIIVPRGGENLVAIEVIRGRIRELLRRSEESTAAFRVAEERGA